MQYFVKFMDKTVEDIGYSKFCHECDFYFIERSEKYIFHEGRSKNEICIFSLQELK